MEKKGTILIVSAAVLWGTAGLFVKQLVSYGVSLYEIVFFRGFFTALIIGTVAAVFSRAAFKIKIRDLWLFAANGILSIVMFNFCYYKTMQLSTLSVAAVLLYTAPVFVMIISLFLFGEKLSLKKALALVLAFLGCAMVSGAFNSTVRISGMALVYGLLTGLGYALYSIFTSLLMKRGYGAVSIIFYTFVFAAVASLLLALLSDSFSLTNIGKNAYFWAFMMGLLNTVLPYILYTLGLKRVEVSKAPIIATVEPVAATILGLFYGEKLTVFGTFGIIMVLISVVILNIRKV